MTGTRRRAAALGCLGAALVLSAAGCGQPTVVPAGSVGVEVPADTADAPVAPAPKKQAAAAPKAVVKSPAQAPKPAAKPKPAPREKAAAPVTTVAAAAGGARAAAGANTPGKKATTAGTKPAAGRTAALPDTGTYTYALTGSSSLGPPPKTSTLTVADGGSGAQLWTLDQRRGDHALGVSARRLDRHRRRHPRVQARLPRAVDPRRRQGRHDVALRPRHLHRRLRDREGRRRAAGRGGCELEPEVPVEHHPEDRRPGQLRAARR